MLAPNFPNLRDSTHASIFVKEQMLSMVDHFEEITVICPLPRTLGLIRSNDSFQDHRIGRMVVYYPRYWYLPIARFRKRLIQTHYKTIVRCIEKKGVDFNLVHAHFTSPSGAIALSVKERFKIPLVLTIHENAQWFDNEMNSSDGDARSVWKGADLLLRARSEDVARLKTFNENVHTMPIGFARSSLQPIDRQEARTRLDLPPDKRIIFSLGGLIKRKGFEHLIDSMALIKEHGLDLLCYIGGTGEEEEALRSRIERLGLSDRLKLIGRVEPDMKRFWMSAADLFVLPSLHESFGLVALEAMACGTPVVATRNGGSEGIVKEVVGLLCLKADAKDLSEKILQALRSHWDRDEIIAYSKGYEWDPINNDIYNLIKNLIYQ